VAAERDVEEKDVALAELLREVRNIEIESRRLAAGVMGGGYRSVFRGAGVEFDDVREYVEGDDPRAVDWNVTARVGRPYVKKYVDERELTLLFLLDLSTSMTGGFGAWSPRQAAVRVCACLALSAVAHNDKVGLVAFSEGVDRYVPPKKGLSHALRIVRDTLALRGAARPTQDSLRSSSVGPGAPRGGTTIDAALAFASRVVRRRSVVFLVSDFLSGGWRAALEICSRRHDVIAIRMLAPELEPPNTGLMRVRDPETGRATVVDWGSARVRAAYEERVARWRAETADHFRRTGVDLMDVKVPRAPDLDAIVRPILDLFRVRELRGERR
jgi:uncharacterized protein (DUF58 family)